MVTKAKSSMSWQMLREERGKIYRESTWSEILSSHITDLVKQKSTDTRLSCDKQIAIRRCNHIIAISSARVEAAKVKSDQCMVC